MASRLDLHELLKGLMGPADSENVYFQPPDSTKMQYPCILYEREGSDTRHADNKKYRHTKRYQVTVIDRQPDSELADKVEEFPLCAIDRKFATSGLNHFVFTLFF